MRGKLGKSGRSTRSRPVSQGSFFAAILLTAAASTYGQGPGAGLVGGHRWEDRQVVPKQARFSLRNDKDGREIFQPPITTFVVRRVEGDRLWTAVNGMNGWCPASEVVAVDEGIPFFTEVIRGGARESYPFAVRAMIYADVKHDTGRAIADLNEAIRIAPNDLALHAMRGRLWSVEEQYENAIADFTHVIEQAGRDPKVAVIFQARGRAYKARRELERAIADFTRALQLQPNAADFLNDRGIAYHSAGQRDKAIADYTRAIAARTKWQATPYHNRGNSYLAKGNLTNAIADFTRAIELDPTLRKSVSCRAVAYMLLRDRAAIVDAAAAIRLAGKDKTAAIYPALTGYFAAKLLADDRQAKVFLDGASTRLWTGEWPSPILSYLIGQLDANRLLAAASDAGEATEAHCFIGLNALLDGQVESARTHFRWIKEKGLPEFTEYAIAVGELNRLDARDRGSRTPGSPRVEPGSK
jgi:tetratricopeptide (TPR) repeat protein